MQRARAICPEPVPFPFQGHDQNRGARECEVFLCIIVGTGEARPRNDPMNTTTPSLEHRPTLDGLRFLAFLGVFLFHIDEGVFPLGALGVKVFFALSGFLICRILILREGPSIHKNLRSFYWRRTLRIFPLYYAVLLGFRLFGGGLEGSRWQYGYAINFYVWRNGRWPVQLGHFWSLAVEEQFYVVFPLILYCSPRRHRAALILMLILVCEAVRFWTSVPCSGVALRDRVDLAWIDGSGRRLRCAELWVRRGGAGRVVGKGRCRDGAVVATHRVPWQDIIWALRVPPADPVMAAATGAEPGRARRRRVGHHGRGSGYVVALLRAADPWLEVVDSYVAGNHQTQLANRQSPNVIRLGSASSPSIR
jgi:Acyltransferase family